jgi:hypothetical protein
VRVGVLYQQKNAGRINLAEEEDGMFIRKALTAVIGVVAVCSSCALPLARQDAPEQGQPGLYEVQGTPYFFDFTGTGERVCNAFLVADNNTHFCLQVNDVSRRLKQEVNGSSKKVKLSGKLYIINDTSYIDVISYTLLQ